MHKLSRRKGGQELREAGRERQGVHELSEQELQKVAGGVCFEGPSEDPFWWHLAYIPEA